MIKGHNAEDVAVFKALADESRLNIISILLEKDTYAEYLAEQLNLSAPTITYHMNKLEQAGIVFSTKIQQYVIYSINRELMDKPVGQFIHAAIDDKNNTFEKKVIKSFFEYGKLKSIPARLKKREIVIGYIASKLEWNRVYSEKELVLELIDIYDDYSTIKRDLIGMGYLEDLNQTYRRVK